MQLTPKQLISAAFAGLACVLQAPAEESSRPNEATELAIVRDWLPHYHQNLQLVFEYDASSERHGNYDAKLLHRSIDKVGPTVVIVEARAPYDEEPRLIGGYNPYKWKNWFGRYQSEPGRFIFDLNKATKWDRRTKASDYIKRSVESYGLSFGNGDLIINPDLKTGSAANSTFAPNKNGSVLLGQAGEFQIDKIRIYSVLPEKPPAGPEPFLSRSPSTEPRDESKANFGHSVPDRSKPFLEIALGLTFLVLAKFAWTRGS